MAKPKSSGGQVNQEQGFVLFWFAGIIVIASWYFGTLVAIACGIAAALGAAWIMKQAVNISHKQCGGKGDAGLGIAAGFCFGLSAAYACSKEHLYGGVIRPSTWS